jgi:hypothetical protein
VPRAAPHTGRKQGNPGRRPPCLKHCPKCGYDLKSLEPVQYGDLFADPIGETFWKNQPVRISVTERIVLHTLLTGTPPRSAGRDWQPGQFVDKLIIAERADSSIDSVDVMICNLRMKFRQVDPTFDHIETKHSEGYRWSAFKVHRPIARWGPGTFVLYDDGELLWRNRWRIFLSAQETKVMKALIDAQGEYIHWTKVNEAIGSETDSAARAAVNRLRQRFKEADPSSLAIYSQSGQASKGYKIVRPDFDKVQRLAA